LAAGETEKDMARSGSEKRKCTVTKACRATPEQAAEIDARADAAGLSVSAFLLAAALGTKPPRKARVAPVDRRAAAQLLGAIGGLTTALRDAADRADSAESAAVVEAMHRDLAEMRTVLFEALGRSP
jgi:hypothetical protein